MALADFQRAVCDLIASPSLCIALRMEPASILGRYELSERERSRLKDIVWQRGMSTNCSLYRSNRITPICTLLRWTCFVLGDGLFQTLDRFLAATELPDVQYLNELERFRQFLMSRIEAGELKNPFLEEVLQYELAANALEFRPRRKILEALSFRPPGTVGDPLTLNPLMKLVRFRHDPDFVLKAVTNLRMPPHDLPERDCFVILSIVTGVLEVMRVRASIGSELQTLESGEPLRVSTEDARILIEARVLVSAEGLWDLLNDCACPSD